MGTESHSGEYAAIDGQAGVRKWNIAKTLPLNESKHSGTRGGTQRKAGVSAWVGGWTSEGGEPGVIPGQSYSFSGYTAPDSDVEGGTGTTYSGTVIISSVTLTLDQATNQILSHDVSFEGHLLLTEAAGGAAIIDSVVSIATSALETKIQFGIGPTELENWTTATLTLTSQITSYVNSSTAGATGRRATSNLDWTLSVTIEDTATALVEGSQIEDVEVFINATEFWSFSHARVGAYSGITCDRESRAIISQVLNLAMDTHDETTGILGAIVAPDLTQIWPPV